MARYHFDYHEAELITVDQTGEEFESIAAARAQGVSARMSYLGAPSWLSNLSVTRPCSYFPGSV